MQSDYFSRFSQLLRRAWEARLAAWEHPELSGDITVERPAISAHGDLSANLAMTAARLVGRPPRELAAELVADVEASGEPGDEIAKVEIAGPGFVNFFLRDTALARAASTALEAGADFGRGAPGGESVLLEFVSANPTGELHVGHARYAAYGDSLRRILEFTGQQVTTEFYVNDYGSQMETFGRSLAARYAQKLGADIPFPEDGYRGDYPVHIAELLSAGIDDRYLGAISSGDWAEAVEFFREGGKGLVLAEMREILAGFRIRFDSWFSEKSLYARGEVEQAIEQLRTAGEIEEREGALWLLTTRYGDDKDRVLIRSNGEPTYFASDIAYHRDKLSRGYGHLINIWGADHHGYVPRMKAAFEALAHDPRRLEIIIGQLVNVLEMGERKQMSKRAGTAVSLGELIGSIGIDAARFFLVDRSHDSTLDLDIEKARLKSEENPVYYVQYAHARICSILRKAEAEGVAGHGEGGRASGAPGVRAGDDNTADERISLAPQEKELLLKLLDLPRSVAAAASARAPQRLTAYSRELAATFHVFYHSCPVLSAEPALASFRLDLCGLTRNVIATCLDLVGVEAPEKM